MIKGWLGAIDLMGLIDLIGLMDFIDLITPFLKTKKR